MTSFPEAGLNASSVLRLLWRARRLVAVGAVVGVMVGTMLVYKVSPGVPPSLERRGHDTGVASSQVLVDSRSSQSVDLGEEPVLIDIPGLIARARLLANLIATSPLRDQIARRAGIDPSTFLATAPSVGFDSPKAQPTDSANGQLSIMNVTFNEALPIVTINAEAASRAAAARISSAAATELGKYIGTLTARDQVKESQQIVIKTLGDPDSATVHRGPRRMSALVAFVLVLGMWCVAIVVITRMRLQRDSPPMSGAAGGTGAAVAALRVVSRPRRTAGAGRLTAPPLSAPPDRPERPERLDCQRRGVSA